MANINIMKKCDICKKYISLKENLDQVVYFEKNKKKSDTKIGVFNHFNCLVEKELNKKRNKSPREEIEQKFKKIQNQKENIEHIKNTILKSEFYKWLQNSYRIVVIPIYFFIKIENIIKGEYQGLAFGIPLEDLFDMWKRQRQELDKIAAKNRSKGKNIDATGRLNYDLAILINRYDNYLQWKVSQKVLSEEIKNSVEENEKTKIDFKEINKTITKQNKKNENDINNILNEVF